MNYFNYLIIITLSCLLNSASSFAQNTYVSTLELDNNLSLDGLLVTPDGTLYGTEGYDGSRLFQIEMDGTTTAVASGLNGPIDLDYDLEGHLYLSTFNNQGLYKITPGQPYQVSLFANVTVGPSGVVVNRSNGEVFVSHYGAGFPGNGNSIYRVTANGASSVFAQGNGLQVPVSLAIDEAGNLYAPNIANARLYKITPDGTVSLLVQLPTAPLHPFNIGHIAYANGYLYVTGNSSQPLVFKVSLEGEYEVIAGDGTIGYQDGEGLQAKFDAPNGIAASVTGDTLFISELNQPGLIRIIALNTTSGDIDIPKEPFAYKLNSCIPNPVSDQAIIEFELGEAEHTLLSIYNMQGQVVDTLINGLMPKGSHRITWNTHGLAGGTYFYQLSAGPFYAQKKVVVLGSGED